MTRKNVKVSIRHLYKIFGADPKGALAKVREGMTKAELLDKTSHVLGLQDINVDMKEGEITVIMGLSGSGKSTLVRCLSRLIEITGGTVSGAPSWLMVWVRVTVLPPEVVVKVILAVRELAEVLGCQLKVKDWLPL